MDLFHGFALLLRTPRLRTLALVPGAGALAAYLILGVVGWFVLAPVAERAMGEWEVIGRFAALAAYLVAFPLVFFLLGSGVLAFVFDPLATAVEEEKGGGPEPTLSRATLVQDAVARIALNLLLGIGAFALSPWLGPVPGLFAAGIAATLDFTAPASLRRGKTLGHQFAGFVRRPDPGLFVFAAVAGFLSLVPLLGPLVAPALIVGGTLLVRRRDSR